MNNINSVLCDGGLSNRLNTLLFALILKDKYGGNWEISWPVNEWCGASFEELFSIDLPTNRNPLSYFKMNENSYTLLMHENQANFSEQNITYHSQICSYAEYESILINSKKPILYYNNLIPTFTDNSDIKNSLNKLITIPEILIPAYSFCINNKIDNTVLGLHIRKTDFGNLVDDNSLFNLAQSSPHRFFVCSDDQQVNDRFSKLSNCHVYPKSSFPSMRSPTNNWNSLSVDDQGRIYNFNICRPSTSIIEALIDLLILSKTTHILTSHSTFLRMSMIFKSAGYFSF